MGAHKTTKAEWGILFFSILYTIMFGTYFFSVGNYEFIWYVIVLFLLITVVSILHYFYQFNNGVLAGLSVWGLIHMAGGSIRINNAVLYRYIIYPFFSVEITGTHILKFDQFAHFYCYIFVTLLLYYIMKSYLDEKTPGVIFGIFLLLASVGIGALYEIIEFIPVLLLENTGVGDYYNTLWDLVFDTLGTLTAVIYLTIKRRMSKNS